MPPLHSLLLFVAAGLALNITPGPDMLYVAARGASEGRSRGNAALQVIGLGLLFDTTGTLVNLAVAIASSRAAARLRAPSARTQPLTAAVFIGLD